MNVPAQFAFLFGGLNTSLLTQLTAPCVAHNTRYAGCGNPQLAATTAAKVAQSRNHAIAQSRNHITQHSAHHFTTRQQVHRRNHVSIPLAHSPPPALSFSTLTLTSTSSSQSLTITALTHHLTDVPSLNDEV